MQALSSPRVARAFAAFLLVISAAHNAQADEPEGTQRTIRRNALQLGFGLGAETVASAGNVCPDDAAAPCLLRSGGGVTIRSGYRYASPWYFGGAYEFSRHDSSSMLRLAILQQLRGEMRYYVDYGRRATPFLAAGLGAHLYGSDWAASTGGPLVTLGGGIEFELSATTVVGAAASYRMLFPRGWTDEAGQRRADGLFGFGLAHLIGLELILEIRDPVPHW
jgi:hypothetical protein